MTTDARRHFLYALLVLFITAFSAADVQAQKSSVLQDASAPDARAFTQWAKTSLIPLSTVKPGAPSDDLMPMARMIGDAKVVALSEAVNRTVEPLEFRNRLFQFLVQEKEFTAIAIEAAGIVESRGIHEYVRSGTGQLDAIIPQGIGFGMERLAQNRALIQWMRQYNADSRHTRKINFYGLDMAGLLRSAHPYFGHDSALLEVLQFLKRTDELAGSAFQSRLEPFLKVRFDPRQPIEGLTYGELSQTQRDTFTGVIADLVIWLERHEAQYSAASTAREYAWAYLAAISARRIDNFLRRTPSGWKPSSTETSAQGELPAFFFDGMDVRDRTQADNVEWIVRQEGSAGKILVFASRTHISAASLRASWHPHRQVSPLQPAGSYLRRRFGQHLVTIGNVIGRSTRGCEEHQRTEWQSPAESLDGATAQVGVPSYLLDLRGAPTEAARWLDQEHQFMAPTQTLRMPARQAFDILFYVDAVTRVCDQ